MKRLFLHCTTDNIEQALPLVKQRGLGIELTSFSHPPLLERPEELVAQHRQWLDGFTGMRSIHGAFYHLIPGAIDPLIREATATRMRQAIGFARETSASHVIFHHGYYARARFDAAWVARSTAFWREILTVVPDGLMVHLENAHEVSPDLQLALIDEVNDPRLGICLDIGHAQVFSQTAVIDWITALGNRITYVHLHDNDGSADQHLPLGEGTIPLIDVLAALEAHAPQAIWTIEAEATRSLEWLEANVCVAKPFPETFTGGFHQ